MPNKRNPDVPELTRAKMARVIGCANEGLNLVRSVMHSYGSDLHELKRTYLTSAGELAAVLEVLPSLVKGLEVDTDRAAELLRNGHILATEIADALTGNGMTFRDAYKIVGAMVELASKLGKQVQELTASELAAGKIELPASLNLGAISYEAAVERRKNMGGTERAEAAEQIKRLRAASRGHRENTQLTGIDKMDRILCFHPAYLVHPCSISFSVFSVPSVAGRF